MRNGITSALAFSLFTLGIGVVSLNAGSLRFSSGIVNTNYNTVALTIAGPSNLVCQVERLNRTNDTWESQGIVNLGASGSAVFTGSLIEGIYGFFRTKATNSSMLSTNAFGAVCGYLDPGHSFIGNMFSAATISSLIPRPPEGMEALKYVNGYGWIIANYESGAWSTNISIGALEGLYIQNGTNQARYVVSGIFDTNAIVKSLPTGLSAICLPLYHINPTNTWVSDTFDTNRLGGFSGVPVQSGGFNPQCTLYQIADSSGLYNTNVLTTNNLWQQRGTNVVLQFKISEGFFIDKPTNSNWSVSRAIW